MNKLVASLFGLGLGMSAVIAPAIAETESKSFYQRLKETPFGAALSTESYSNPRTKNGKTELDINNEHRLFPQAEYKLNETTRFKLIPRFDLYKKAGSDEFTSNTYQVAFRVDKSAILSESTDGVDLSADMRYYSYVNAKSRKEQGGLGNLNLRTYLDKNFSDVLSLNNETRLWVLNKGEGTLDSTPRAFADIYVTPKYKLMDKFALDTEAEYVFKFKTGKDVDSLMLTPHLVYEPTDRLSAKLGMQFETERESDVSETGAALRDPYALDGSLAYTFTDAVSAELFLEAPTRANTEAGADQFKFVDNMKLELDLAMTFF